MEAIIAIVVVVVILAIILIAQLDENRFGSALGFTKEHLGQSTK